MKILVTCPHFNLLGGVANHYQGLSQYWTETVKYLEIGNRGGKAGNGKYWIIWDILRLIIKLIFYRPDCVLLNPSIGSNALRRDFLFQNVAKFFGIPTAIFIHGFNLQIFDQIDKTWLTRNLNKSRVIFVLAKDFKYRLEKCGVTTPIETTTTKVDDKLVQDFDIRYRDGKSGNLLFLARVDKAKGIHETLDAYKILKADFPNLQLNIVGNGPELPVIIDRIDKEKIDGVIISGRLAGKKISEAYKSALLLLLLTHGEGMPTTILEAMAFGLPIITRPVGGIVDFFENGSMGFISDSLDPNVFAEGIKKYLNDTELTKKISLYNYAYAKRNFMASDVAGKIESILKKYI